MIKFKVQHHKVFIDEASSHELALLKKSLKIYAPVFNPGPGMPPFEVINLFYKDDKSFPTGYLSHVEDKLKKNAVEYKIQDLRKYPTGKLPFRFDPDVEPLWENQKEALDNIRLNVYGTISSATGTGKTRLIEETIALRQVKTLIIVPYRMIQNQVANRLIKTFGKKHVSTKIPKKDLNNPEKTQYDSPTYKKVGGDISELYNKNDKDAPITSGKKLGSSYMIEVDESKPKTKLGSSYTSLYSKEESPEDAFLKKKGIDKKTGFKQSSFNNIKSKDKKIKKKEKKVSLGSNITVICFNSLPEASQEFLDSVECVIIDECHHSSAITIREALDRMPNAAYRYGFSATPWRDKSADQKLLLAALGDKIIYDLKGDEAVERGIIARPKYHVITAPAPDMWLQEDKNWRMIVEKGIIGNTSRNKSIVKKAMELYQNDHNVFICVDEIAHLEILQQRFKDQGVEVLIIHGEQNSKINDENIKKIGTSTKGIISIGTMAVGEGTDMPNISAIILASGGKASIRFLQRIGRGTRLTNGKNEVIVVDFEDFFNPTLLKHSRERKRIFNKYFNSK